MTADTTPREALAVAQRALAKTVELEDTIAARRCELDQLREATDEVEEKVDRLEARRGDR